MPDEPNLNLRVPRNPEGVALILHGGADSGQEPIRPFDHAYLRMLPFAWALQRTAGTRLVVGLLRNRVRGWNGAAQDSVADAHWALERLHQQFPDLPVGLVGHSLGGRTAIHVGGYPTVTSVAALAPWIPDSTPTDQLAGRRVLLVHGSADRITSSAATTIYAARLRLAGVDVTSVKLPGGHTMLRGAADWHGLASRFTANALLGTPVS